MNVSPPKIMSMPSGPGALLQGRVANDSKYAAHLSSMFVFLYTCL